MSGIIFYATANDPLNVQQAEYVLRGAEQERIILTAFNVWPEHLGIRAGITHCISHEGLQTQPVELLSPTTFEATNSALLMVALLRAKQGQTAGTYICTLEVGPYPKSGEYEYLQRQFFVRIIE